MAFRFCPHCGKELPIAPAPLPVSAPEREPDPSPPATPAYDQTAYWRALHARVDDGARPPDTQELVAEVVRRLPPARSSPQASIVHVLLDRPATPAGGALLQSVRSDGRLGPAGTPERLEQLGYVLQDGRVRQEGGIPVGRAYIVLEYWGGERQHKRWHLAEPVALDPSRHGDPFFMDERSIAFGARWRDLDRFAEAMTALIETFRNGFDGISVGHPFVVDVYWSDAPSSRE
jgi:hypothetical protein